MTKPFEIKTNVSLKDLTTFKIGGEASFFVNAGSESDVFAALGFAEKKGIDVFVLGGGSNILISDDGFDGLVLQIGLKGILVNEKSHGGVEIRANAGEDWDDLVAYCVEREYAGIECLSGIPGFVGGTPIQNVGAYGQEVSESIESVRVFDRLTRSIENISNSECGFEYRRSIFNTTHKDRYVVLSTTYLLQVNGAPRITYADLQEKFGDSEPGLAETRAAVCDIRRSKGMLVRQGGPDSQSAGSFFKNPVVDRKSFESISAKAISRELGPVPNYPTGENMIKIPAAWLIERSGFSKGFRIGNAGLSTVHSLALTNRGGAAACEILELKNVIQKGVSENFGIDLVPEPNLIGFS
ncbi:MAG: UDP-N-acetylmuramate dehydrogenase [Pyrinomonadaceae bacterium]